MKFSPFACMTILLAAAAVHGAPMASEGFVTNKIAAAIAALPAPDYSTNNTALVETIEAVAPAQEEVDPTVPSWAKAASKPSYTAGEVGAATPADVASVASAAQAADAKAGAAAIKAQMAVNAANTAQDTIDAHAADATIHVSAVEKATWNAKQDALAFDAVPTAGSTNPVTSGGVQSALALKANAANVYTKAETDAAIAAATPEETDPTVPAWAKAAQKPTYTAGEVGAATPAAVSNIVSTAYVREKLGVYLYVGEDGGIYVHTNED